MGSAVSLCSPSSSSSSSLVWGCSPAAIIFCAFAIASSAALSAVDCSTMEAGARGSSDGGAMISSAS
eukprot:2696935-Prymnesium_polylepis.1